MQCSLFHSLLDRTIESCSGVVSPEVREHGLTCTHSECQQSWRDYSLLSQVIPLWNAQFPEVDLADRVLSELNPPNSVADTAPFGSNSPAFKAYFEQSWTDFRSPQQRPWSIALVIAACTLLIATLILAIPQSPHTAIAVRQRQNPVWERTPMADISGWASHSPRETSVAPVPNVAGQSVVWAQKASHAMADAFVSIPVKGANWMPSEDWNADFLHKLEPLRRDAHEAWDALLEKLPTDSGPPS